MEITKKRNGYVKRRSWTLCDDLFATNRDRVVVVVEEVSDGEVVLDRNVVAVDEISDCDEMFYRNNKKKR